MSAPIVPDMDDLTRVLQAKGLLNLLSQLSKRERNVLIILSPFHNKFNKLKDI